MTIAKDLNTFKYRRAPGQQQGSVMSGKYPIGNISHNSHKQS